MNRYFNLATPVSPSPLVLTLLRLGMDYLIRYDLKELDYTRDTGSAVCIKGFVNRLGNVISCALWKREINLRLQMTVHIVAAWSDILLVVVLSAGVSRSYNFTRFLRKWSIHNKVDLQRM